MSLLGEKSRERRQRFAENRMDADERVEIAPRGVPIRGSMANRINEAVVGRAPSREPSGILVAVTTSSHGEQTLGAETSPRWTKRSSHLAEAIL
jgi:hypothetical protein